MKYPGLTEAIEVAGSIVSYNVAFVRLDHGWSLERAVGTPKRERGPNKTWSEKRAAIAARKLGRPPAIRKVRKQFIRATDDTSPDHIRKIREAYCDQFMKTGVLDRSMMEQLREYANGCRATENRSVGVSDEQTPRRHRGRQPRLGDLGRGSGHQTDA